MSVGLSAKSFEYLAHSDSLSVAVLSRFLLVVEVTGNERIPSAVILSELQRFGVYPGAYGPSIDTKEICNEMLLAIPELGYLTVQVSGIRAEVAVKEKVAVPSSTVTVGCAVILTDVIT